MILVSVLIACVGKKKKKGNVLFNDALNIFNLRLCDVEHMVKDHSESVCVCVCV